MNLPMKEVKIKLLNDNAKVPTKAIYNDACYDVVATSRKDYGDGRIEYGLGLAFELNENTQLDVRARSSIHKTGLILSNCIGTGDEGYRGEYKVVFYHVIPSLPPYEVGDRVAQIQIKSREDVEFVVAEELSESVRGEGGWGHSGLKELDTKTQELVQDIANLGTDSEEDILRGIHKSLSEEYSSKIDSYIKEIQELVDDRTKDVANYLEMGKSFIDAEMEFEGWVKELDEVRRSEMADFISKEYPDLPTDEAIKELEESIVERVKLGVDDKVNGEGVKEILERYEDEKDKLIQESSDLTEEKTNRLNLFDECLKLSNTGDFTEMAKWAETHDSERFEKIKALLSKEFPHLTLEESIEKLAEDILTSKLSHFQNKERVLTNSNIKSTHALPLWESHKEDQKNMEDMFVDGFNLRKPTLSEFLDKIEILAKLQLDSNKVEIDVLTRTIVDSAYKFKAQMEGISSTEDYNFPKEIREMDVIELLEENNKTLKKVIDILTDYRVDNSTTTNNTQTDIENWSEELKKKQNLMLDQIYNDEIEYFKSSNEDNDPWGAGLTRPFKS